jgi:hypothetical protein
MNDTETITEILRRLLPHHDPQRGDRPEQAARPEGGAGRAQVYSPEQVESWWSCISAARTATSSTRSSMPAWPSTREQLDEDGQVDFKGKAKAFTRTYDFLASILPYTNAGVGEALDLPELPHPKLPAPKEEDLSKGILEAIDMDSYRVEKKAAMKIALADEDAEIEPVPTMAAATSPSRAGPLEQHPQDVQRPVRQTPSAAG